MAFDECGSKIENGKAYYWNTIQNFIIDKAENIVGKLVKNAFEVNKDQTNAWNDQIQSLQERLKSCEMRGNIIFEYDIVRLGKRIDVIMLIKHMVFSLEFKNGKNVFTAQDAQQAEDYAIDIKNFHKESKDLYVCPILIATKANDFNNTQSIDCYPDKQIFLQRENIESLLPKIVQIIKKYGSDEEINFEKWFNSPYYPTPTIIDAAVEAYRSHNVEEIARSEAGQTNITKCENELNKIINYAKEKSKKCVCFVTGVPGAGKTLVGLDIVAKNLKQGYKKLSVYLSGNGPLVEVLRAALIKNAKSNTDKKEHIKKHEIEAAINTLIQSSYNFKKDNANSENPTPENIMIFDEAQRVWNEEKMKQKHDDPKMNVSEPHLLFEIMNRHKDWAVMICLVGLGQDIYDGEVGINEWFRCGIDEYTDWEMFYSSSIFHQSEDKNIECEKIKNCPRCHDVSQLHLNTSVRSFRADKQCKFIDYLLDNMPQEASDIYQQIKTKYPIYITRDFNEAKKWVKCQVRGSQRCGVLACSSAQRLKPEGIYVPKDIDVQNWFLAPSDDLRSSNKLEIVASEFKVQGLEIDWAVVCWDADLRRNNANWEHYTFRGTKWERRKKIEQKRYLENSYRVLLTRARQGMIIFVPKGAEPEEDPTRNKKFYDDIFAYLCSCGIQEI